LCSHRWCRLRWRSCYCWESRSHRCWRKHVIGIQRWCQSGRTFKSCN
jgi:hypothetical protein